MAFHTNTCVEGDVFVPMHCHNYVRARQVQETVLCKTSDDKKNGKRKCTLGMQRFPQFSP